MKSHLTLILILLGGLLSAQVEFKVELLPASNTYQVSLRPQTTWAAPFNATPSAQVTLVVVTGGFQVGTVTSIDGLWNFNVQVVAPVESPGKDYLVFGLQGATSDIVYQQGVEVPLFSFENTGGCTGILELIDNDTDPFIPPNSQSVNVGNQISVIGAGIGVNAYVGNYALGAANCDPGGECIVVNDILTTSPSNCGLADGMISIAATSNNGLGLQYSIDGGDNWQGESAFTGLAAGMVFDVQVRDIAGICVVEGGLIELDAPIAAAITNLVTTEPDCGASNGSISITATSENGGALEFSIDDGITWQQSGDFANLADGSYPSWVRNLGNNCQTSIGDFVLTEDCSGGPSACLMTYEIEQLPDGRFLASLIPGITWTFPDNITSSAQVTVKVPTGSFQFSNLTNAIPNVVFSINSINTAPVEDPAHDYISVGLASFGTTNILYEEGVKVALFTFENSGTCTGDTISLMDNNTDPFFPPNSQNANVGQQLTVAGFGGADMPICNRYNSTPDCLPQIVQDTVFVEISGLTPTTTCLGDALQLPNGAGNASLCGNGTFVNATLSNGSDCVDLQALMPFNQADQVCVIHCDANDASLCDTTILILCPKVDAGPDLEICESETIQLNVLGGTGNYHWSPATGLSCTNCPNPQATPDTTTTYIVTSEDDINCCTEDTITILVNPLPQVEFLSKNACMGEAVIFENATTSVEPIISQLWDFGENGATSNEENPTHIYANPGNFEVSLTVTVGAGCAATFTDSVTVFPGVEVTVADSFVICQGTGIQLEASGNGNPVWTPASGLDDPNSFTPTASPSQTTTYTITVSNEFVCTATDTVRVEVIDPPTADFSISNPTCLDGKVEINFTGSASPNALLFWELDGGSLLFSSPATGGQPEGARLFVSWPTTGEKTIGLLVKDGGCPATASHGISITEFAPGATPSVQAVSACDQTDGAISLSLSGTDNYAFEWNGPNGFQSTDQNISGLASGSYHLSIQEVNSTCLAELTVEVPVLNGPVLTPSEINLSHNSCPGDSLGSITSNTGIEYEIRDSSGQSIGTTPLTNLPKGSYTLVNSEGGCEISLDVEITGPEDWSVSFSSSPETCIGADGSIALDVGGANGGYSFEWSGGVSTTNMAEGLSSGTYDVTISDSLGCSKMLSNMEVGFDCDTAILCPSVFTLETFFVTENLAEEFTETCLPTNEPDLSIFTLTLDGVVYQNGLGACLENTIFYSFGSVLNLGEPPFQLLSWSHGPDTLPSFTFNNAMALVDQMNALDPTGNWVFNLGDNSISGGSNDEIYGNLVVSHLASNTTLTLQTNFSSISHESIFVSGLGEHQFIVEEMGNPCSDTLIIDVLEKQFRTDTIRVELKTGQTETLCMNLAELPGTPASIGDICSTENSGIASLQFNSPECVDITGTEVGNGTACILLCDDLGYCDTTIVTIKVGTSDLLVYNGFSPNGDGINDFLNIENIELFPNNRIQIFNRWGSRVFKQDNYSNRNPWNGKYRGEDLPDGTYFYLLKDGKGKTLSGYIQIRR